MLVGRSSECAQIDGLLAALDDRRGGACLLVGEPGIGKTALLDAAARGATDVLVLTATGVEAEADLPFAALAEVAAPLSRLLDQLAPPQRAALGAALAIAEGPPAQPDRLATCTGFLALLRLAAADQPVLVVLDDAQWLDGPSAECLGYAARRVGADAVAFIVAARETTPVPAFSGAPIQELRLAPLDPEPAASLLAEHAGGVAASTRAALLEAARGNPLALVELPGSLTDEQRRGVAAFDPAPRSGTPLWAAFERQLVAAGDAASAAALVTAASVDRAAVPIAAACADLGLGDDALEAAEAARLIRVSPQRITLSHPLLRGVVIDHAGPREQRRAHAALAAHTPPDVRAWHLASAAVGASAEAADALDAAGLRAAGRGAHVVAGAAYSRAAELTPDPLQALGRRLIAAAQLGFGGAYAQASDTLEPVTQAEDEHLAGAARHLRAVIGLVGGVGPVLGHHAVLEAEAARVAGHDPAGAASALADAAMVAIVGGDCRAALSSAQAAVALLTDELPALPRAQALAMLGLTLGLTGEAAAARPVLADVGPLLADIDPVSPMAGTISFGLHGRNLMGDTAELRAEILRLAAPVRESGAHGLLPHYLVVAADTALRLGDWETAASEAHEAVSIADLHGQHGPLVAALAVRARLGAACGDADGALDDLERVETLARPAGYVSASMQAEAARGFLELTQGRVADAILTLEEVGRRAADAGIKDPISNVWIPDLVEAYVAAGQLDRAVELAGEYDDAATHAGTDLALALAARCRGLVDDDFDPAFARALDHHPAADAPFDEARTLLCFGARLHRARRRAQARDVLRDARERFALLGATPWTARADAELAAAGGINRPAITDDPDALTAQELRIARAVARGATNREVAAELFVSPKTIEFHLGRVYRKLGIRSRVELAALAAAGGLDDLA